MDANEIMKIAGIAGISLGAILAIAGLGNTSLVSRRIKSQEELERVALEEALELGLNPSCIKVNFGAGDTSARFNGEGYEINMKKDEFATRPIVRHELAHIYNGDCDRERTPLFYYLVAEPRAMLYGLMRLKTSQKKAKNA